MVRYFAIFFTLTVFAIFTEPCIANDNMDSSKGRLQPVTLQLKWKHQFQFAGYYAALEKGFYKDAGLNVKILEIKDGEEAIDKVVDGKADFGVGMSDLIVHRAKGQPVVVLAAIFQHSPLIILAPKTSGIENIHTLHGKRFGMEADSAELIAYIQNEGLSLDEIELFPHDYNIFNLISGKVDAISAYSTDEPFMLLNQGIEYFTFTPRAAGIDFYGDTLFTSEKQIEEHPKRVSAFLHASLKGWQYALENPEEIIELILSKYTQRHSREHLLFEAHHSANLIMANVVQLGYMHPGRWRQIAQTYTELGMIDNNFSLDGFLYSFESDADYDWLKKVLWIFIGISVLLGVGAIILAFFNRKLAVEVTERRKAEKMLQNSEQKLRNIVENATNLFYSHTAKHDLTYISPQCREFLQCEPAEAMIQWTEFATDNPNNEKGFKLTEKAINTGKPQAPYELELIGTKGKIITVEVRETPIVEHGKTVAIVGSLTDVTERKKTEEDLVRSESRYRALFDFSPIQTVVVDNDGKITMFNFAKERSGGRIPSVGDVMYMDYADKHEIDMHKELMECIQTGEKKAFSELKYKELFLNINISPFSGGAIITSEDITERKKLQSLVEQVHKMEAIGTLSGGIAHEFNNILGIILGNAELAMDDIPENNPTYEFLSEVKNASIRGKDIVRQLLRFSHKSDLKKQAIDIGKVVRESIKFLRASIPSSIEFEENITDDVITIKGDKTQIHQIMMNLCNNASQSMEEMGGKLKIVLEKQHLYEKRLFLGQQIEPGYYAKLIVEDAGKGIPSKVLKNIFDPFFSTKSADEGSGMGLAVVYGIVKGHDGFIEIESLINSGAKVICYFPITNEVPNDVNETTEPPIEGHGNILFVDDEVSLVKMGKLQLEKLGYEVVATSDPSKVLEEFKANPNKYDLVITDMTMPKMTGDRLIKELRKIKASVKTIICTGYSYRMNEENVVQIGATDYIMKPIDRKKLAETVRKVLDEAEG